MRKTTLRRLSDRPVLAAVSLLICLLMLVMSAPAFAAEADIAADPATADNWEVLNYDANEGRTTKNDGRIWTDKSVWVSDAGVLKNNNNEKLTIEKSNDSDFLVGLSALSSTMTVDGVTAVPLDIVLVLDVSGSMNDSMGYTEVYADEMNYQGTYYVKNGNNYTKLSYSYQTSNGTRWYYRAYNRTIWVTPKTSADDTEGTPVYKSVTKMEALEDAVNKFIDSTAEMNEKVTSQEKQHRIALVKFSGNKNATTGNRTYVYDGDTYNYSQVVKEFAVVTDTTVQSFRNSVASLSPAGATRADYGLQVAEGVMEDARANAQKVVIFFTDGKPTSFSEWNATVANDAIKSAKNMKDDGAWIYSVGVFGGDSNNTDLNNYMNAVSSNYPKATGYAKNTMGTRVPAGENYYFTADDADALLNVFEGIAKEIAGKAAEYPTHIEEGYDASKGGFVTFTDKLGAYMEVSSFKSVVYKGVEYKNTGIGDVFVNDTTVTNDLGEDVRIDSVIVDVERSADPAVGDTITVKIPAALIPLAYYNVTIDDNGAITERIPTTPIRAFYEVSLKDEALELLENPDAGMAAYLAENTGSDGKAVFYSNAYDKQENSLTGSTVATFTPSAMNDMYITVDDTLIYADAACTQPVTRINESATYYYKRVYYVESNTPMNPKYEIVAFSASLLRYVDYAFNDDGQLYVKAGEGRHTRLDAYDTEKSENITGTAVNAAAPRWAYWNVPNSEVPVYLGNNGILKKDIPGTLAISKKVSVPSWANVAVDNVEFTFNVSFEGVNDGTFKTSVGTIAIENGKATVKLKADETLYIYGLPAGTAYTVSEATPSGGFEQSSPSDDSGQLADATGIIVSGKTSTAAFVNTYSATGMLKGETDLNGSKRLEGRNWRSTDKFAFVLVPEKANYPMPENAVEIDRTSMSVATVEGTDGANAPIAFNFGDIVYTQPGTYTYEIREVIIDNYAERIPGITYSQDVYEVTVVVTDKGDGSLDVTSSMKLSGEAVEVAEFLNVHEKDSETFSIVARKHLVDETETFELKNGSFSFKLKAVTPGAPMPAGAEDGVYIAMNNGINISFGSIQHTLSEEAIIEAGGALTYTYEVSEVKGDISGMKYDSNKYQVQVVFGWDEKEELVFDIQYPGVNNWVTFTNTFDPEDTTATIDVNKNIIGREWKDNETFKFQLEGKNNAPMPTEANGELNYEFAVGENGAQLGINYDKPGTYEYVLSEVAGTAGGVQYDTRKVGVTVEVELADGKLSAAVSYDGGDTAPTFENKYSSVLKYPGITVTKVLHGRDMTFGEFDFVIEPVSDVAKEKGIADTDKSFESGAHPSGEVCTMTGKLAGLSFDQEDSGEAFIYKIYEVLPEDDNDHAGIQKNGVTYDESVYYVVITPTDNGDGSMSAETKVYTDEKREVPKYSWKTNEQAETIDFSNEYGFEDVTVDTGAYFTKVFEGREWLDSDTFTFKLTAQTEGAPMPAGTEGNVATVTVGKPESGNVQIVDFGTITFEEEGTYIYDISELEGNLPKVKYDAHTATLKITVTDNGRGKLVAAVTVENGVFTNAYSDEVLYPDVTTLDVTKSLEGRELRERQFAFKVVPGDILSMRKAGMQTLEGIEFRNGAPDKDGISHMFSPDQLKFTEDDLGITYAYTFTEVNDGVKGYSYDPNVYTLEIKADYKDGQIVVNTKILKGTEDNSEVIYDVDGYNDITEKPVVTIPFVNKYKAESASLKFEGTKEMTGRELVDGEFTFVLAYAADQDKTPVSSVTNESGKVIFAEQTYTLESLAELVKEGYATKVSDEMVDTYTISYVAFEKENNVPGVTHTEDSFQFTVTVTDAGEGKLAAEASYPEGGIAFRNTYSTGDPIDVVIKGQKVLNFEEGLTPDSIAGKFTFELTAQTEGAPMPSVTKVTNDESGNVVFGSISFDMALLKDVEAVEKVRTKEFVYTVTESGNVDGITNDEETEKTFSITLVDDGEGHLSVVPSGEGSRFTFTNTYDADKVTESITGEGNLTVTKKLNGRDMQVGEFEFELVEGQEVVAEGTNAADGTVTFEKVTYDKVGTHTYIVREVQGEAVGVTYDTTAYQVKAVVTDNGKGQLEVDFSIVSEGVNEIVFTNEYDPAAATVSVTPVKALTGRELIDGEFEFKMTAVTENAPMPEKDIVTNDADGKINFGVITFEEAGTYEYTLAEIKGEFVNITYDETVHNMKVVVTDNGEGQLEADVTYDGKEAVPVFENKYRKPEVKESITGEGNLTITKKLNGRDMEKDEFLFELVDGQDVVAEGSNNIDGTVTFGYITYNEPGTYTYIVREIQGDAVGVTYDNTTYQVKAVVTDNGKGVLDVEFSIADKDIEAIEFVNEYKPESTAITAVMTKKLEGYELSNGEFSFRMTAVTENAPMPEKDVVTNDADGKIDFGVITYEEAGIYRYNLAEVKGDVKNITYDETVHKMKVVVTDNAGKLEAEVTYDDKDEAPVFVNVYAEPNPDTGDDMSVVFYMMMAVVCLIVAVYCIRRKRVN